MRVDLSIQIVCNERTNILECIQNKGFVWYTHYNEFLWYEGKTMEQLSSQKVNV